MNRYITLGVCFFLLLACTSPVRKDNELLKAEKQYEHFLSNYYVRGDVSNIDSALKYNAILLDNDSVSIVQYLNQIMLLYLSSNYDSALTFIDTIPQNMVSWVPGYKMYLRLKCKAIMARESGDTCSYYNYLDSIIIRWEPVIIDSIEKCDSAFSTPIDSVPFHLCFLYENYYEIFSRLYGKDSVSQLFSSKQKRYNWDDETYTFITKCANRDALLSLP